MLIKLSLRDIESGASPSGWSSHIIAAEHGLRLQGDDTGLVALYLHRHPSCVTVSTDLPLLLDDLGGRGIAPGVSPAGVSHLLHDALVPIPNTVYQDIHFVGLGDRCDLRAADGSAKLTFSNAHPYFLENSAEDRTADAKHLLQLLTQAVTRQVETCRDSFLMLSSGKDSSALALALAEAGYRDFPCVTFQSDDDDGEHVFAAALCRRLGLNHETVDIGAGDGRTRELLTAFFTRTSLPCGDFAQIPYALCAAAVGGSVRGVVDGSGNDCFLGDLPSRNERIRFRLAIGSGPIAGMIEKCLHPDSVLNYFLRSRSASILPGRTFRPIDTRAFYPGSVDTAKWWSDLNRQSRHLGAIEIRNSPVMRHVDQAAILLKVRLAAESRGLNVLLPFCDRDVIDYTFNLPERERFDRSTGTNKLLLRTMLKRFIDYDADAIGKRWFKFDGAKFLLDHREFVLDEITGCRLWNARISELAEQWMRRLEHKHFMYHALLPLFMLSGWHNHSRFVDNRLTPSPDGGE